MAVDVIKCFLDDVFGGPLMAALKFKDLQPLALRFAQPRDLSAIRVFFPDGECDGRYADAVESAEAVIERADARP